MIPLGFLLFSSGFVVTLLMALWKMINGDLGDEKMTAGSVIRLFKWPLVFLVLFILFIAFGVPYLEQQA